jgi:hypothetical protein
VGAHLAQVDEEQADPVGAARRVVRAGAGARQQHEQVGLLDAARPVPVIILWSASGSDA